MNAFDFSNVLTILANPSDWTQYRLQKLVNQLQQGKLNNPSVVTVLTNYSVVDGDYGINANATGGGFNVTILSAKRTGKVLFIRNVGSANVVTILTQGSDLINGGNSLNLGVGKSFFGQADGVSNWNGIVA